MESGLERATQKLPCREPFRAVGNELNGVAGSGMIAVVKSRVHHVAKSADNSIANTSSLIISNVTESHITVQRLVCTPLLVTPAKTLSSGWISASSSSLDIQ